MARRNEGPAPFFLAGQRALDLLNSVAAPWGSPIEWLGDGGEFLTWLELAGLVPAPVLRRFRKEALAGELDDVAARARDLREWFRRFVHGHAGRPLAPSALADLAPINRILRRDSNYRQIVASPALTPDADSHGATLCWRQNRHWPSVDSLLLPLAELMGEMICGCDFRRVKKCEGPTCSMWFHDTSKNRTRRWCSMAVCGNRAKAAAHRVRSKDKP